MATALETAARTGAGEQRVLIRGVGWQGYQALMEMVAEQPLRLTYDQGDLELMSPLFKHERHRCLLARIVEIITVELQIPRLTAGSTTLKRQDLDRGLEADAAFYLGDLSRISNRDDLNLDVDPPPDLAIEVEITRSVLSRLGIYGALGVPEIWRFDGRTLRILERQIDGSYQETTTSKVLPFVSVHEIMQLATEDQPDESRWELSVRQWVQDVVLPRLPRDGSE